MKTGGRRKISPARSIALQVLRRVEAEGAFSSLALNHALRRHATLSPEDRALATELTYGTLRWRRRLDYALSAHSHRRLEKVEPSLLRILRLSAYQLMFLDTIPDWAAVDQGTEMATVMRGRRSKSLRGSRRRGKPIQGIAAGSRTCERASSLRRNDDNSCDDGDSRAA